MQLFLRPLVNVFHEEVTVTASIVDSDKEVGVAHHVFNRHTFELCYRVILRCYYKSRCLDVWNVDVAGK